MRLTWILKDVYANYTNWAIQRLRAQEISSFRNYTSWLVLLPYSHREVGGSNLDFYNIQFIKT